MAKILVTDDRPINRQYLTTLLCYKGHTVLEASDGAISLEISINELPDLIITDIIMPTMDGYEFVERLRNNSKTAEIPVIFYTAALQEESAKSIERFRGTRVIIKPSEPETILNVVNEVLRRTAKTEDGVKDNM